MCRRKVDSMNAWNIRCGSWISNAFCLVIRLQIILPTYLSRAYKVLISAVQVGKQAGHFRTSAL
jgi:hypothetical protein